MKFFTRITRLRLASVFAQASYAGQVGAAGPPSLKLLSSLSRASPRQDGTASRIFKKLSDNRKLLIRYGYRKL
jgi:hypothetical protein